MPERDTLRHPLWTPQSTRPATRARQLTPSAQSGRGFVLLRTITGAAGTYPPSELKTMLQWMRDVAKDGAKLIVIEKPADRPVGQ